MLLLYQHPATRFTCRHCGKDAGHDPEMCVYCGPVCGECFNDPKPCKGELRHQFEVQVKKESDKDYEI